MHLQFLKKEGFKKGKGKHAEPISWNSELVSINAGEIRQWFGDFQGSMDQLPKVVTKEANRLLNGMINKIRSMSQLIACDLKLC